MCKTEVIIPEKESTLTVLDNFLSRSATQYFIEIGVAVPGIKQSLKQADRQTDMTKLIAAFHNFANAHKKMNMTLQHKA